MEVGRRASGAGTSKGKGRGKRMSTTTKPAGVSKTDNRTETPEIKKDDGVENPDKDALESTDSTEAPPSGDGENQQQQEGLAAATGSEANDDAAEKAEAEVDIAAAGTGRFVDDALDQARDNEKQAFQNLINEGVKTQIELEKTAAKLATTEADLEEKKKELEKEQEKNKEHRAKIHELEMTIKECEEEKRRLAAELAIAEGKNASATEEGDESKTEDQDEDGNLNDEFITTEQRLKDLQLRLKRMVRDEEEKDAYIIDLTRQLKVTEDTLDDIEPHVDKVKWQEVMEKRQAALEQRQPGENGEGLVNGEDNLVRRSDAVAKSKVCAIM